MLKQIRSVVVGIIMIFFVMVLINGCMNEQIKVSQNARFEKYYAENCQPTDHKVLSSGKYAHTEVEYKCNDYNRYLSTCEINQYNKWVYHKEQK